MKNAPIRNYKSQLEGALQHCTATPHKHTHTSALRASLSGVKRKERLALRERERVGERKSGRSKDARKTETRFFFFQPFFFLWPGYREHVGTGFWREGEASTTKSRPR